MRNKSLHPIMFTADDIVFIIKIRYYAKLIVYLN